jgi:hypothetical protein
MQKLTPFLFAATILLAAAQAQDLRALPSGVALDTVYSIAISTKGPTFAVHIQILQSDESYGRATHYLIEFFHHLGSPALQTIVDSASLFPVFHVTSDNFRDADYCPEDPNFEPAVNHAIANNDFVQFLDMNFDGYMDFRLLHNEDVHGAFSYNYWLFDPLSSTFRPDSALSYYCCYPSLDPKHKIIATMGMGGWDKLQFKGSELLLIEHTEREMVDINGRVKYRYTTFQLIDGRMKTTKVIYADQ